MVQKYLDTKIYIDKNESKGITFTIIEHTEENKTLLKKWLSNTRFN